MCKQQVGASKVTFPKARLYFLKQKNGSNRKRQSGQIAFFRSGVLPFSPSFDRTVLLLRAKSLSSRKEAVAAEDRQTAEQEDDT
jgi:hypothetical protein